MSTITANTGSVTWNTNGAWVGGIQPTAADDVVIPASAIVTIPTATTALGRSLTVQSSGTIAFATTTSVLTLGDATAGAGNVALSVSSGATVTLTGIGTINFISTSATVQTIATGGKTMPNFTLNGSTGSWQLTDSSTISNITHATGTFSTNNQTVSTGTMDAIGGSGTLTFGSSAISATFWQVRNFKTITANTATVTLSNASSSFDNNHVAGTNYNGMSVIQSGSGTCVLGPSGGGGGPITLANYTRTGSASKIDALSIGTTSLTCTGTFTANGNSVTNRLIVQSSTLGTARTITAATVSMSNVDFADITGAGAATWSGTSIGNALGNSGITFTTPVTRYCVSTGGAIDLDSTTMWATTSGGASGASVPLCHDDVVFDANSAATNNRLNQTRFCRNLTVTSGFIRSLTATNPTANTIYGDVVFGANMTGLGNSSSGHWQLSGRGAQTIQMNGASFSNTSSSGLVSIITPSGSYSMQDAFSGSSGTLNVQAGTLNTNNYSITIPSFLANQGALARTVNLGTSIVTVSTWTASGVTLNASSSTIVIAKASTASRTFGGGGLTYGTLNYTVANSPGTLAITGANTFGTLNIGPGRTVTSPAAVIQTIGSLNTSGQKFDYQYLPGGTAQYASAPDSSALSITGDLDVRVRIDSDSWTAGAPAFAEKYLSTGNQLSWAFVGNNGLLQLTLSSNGSTVNNSISSVGHGFTNGQTKWIRFTYRQSDRRVQFFTAPDNTSMPSSWTQLGTDRTNTQTSIFDSTSPLLMGSSQVGGLGSTTIGNRIYRCQVRNNIIDDGTGIVFDADFSTKSFGAATFTESSSNAATVTINGATALVGDGRVTLASLTASSPTYLMLAGEIQSFDYLAVQDVVSLLPYKFYAGTNSVNVSGNTNVLFSDYVTSTPYPVFVGEVSASGTSQSVALNVPPGQAVLPGDLMLADDRVSTTATVSVSGFTAVGSPVSDSTTTVSVFHRVAVGGETGVTFTTAGSDVHQGQLIVIRGLSGPVLDVTDSVTNGAGTTTTLSTGSGVTNTAIPAFAMAYWGAQNVSNPAISFTNSFQQAKTSIAGQSANYSAFKPLTSLASQTSTLTTTSNMGRAVGRMIVFKGTPVVGGNYRFLFVQY